MVWLLRRLLHMQLPEDAFGTAQDTENQELELALGVSGEEAGSHLHYPSSTHSSGLYCSSTFSKKSS